MLQNNYEWSCKVRKGAAHFLDKLPFRQLQILFEIVTDQRASNRSQDSLIQGISNSAKPPHHLLQSSIFNISTLKAALKDYHPDLGGMGELEDENSYILRLRCLVLMEWDADDVGPIKSCISLSYSWLLACWCKFADTG